jgi:hypothetical protein
MQAKDSLQKRQRRFITALFKEYLEILGEVKASHDEFYGNLLDKLPKEYIPILVVGNPFSKEKYQRLRKKILDSGNDVIRESDLEIDNYEVSFCL